MGVGLKRIQYFTNIIKYFLNIFYYDFEVLILNLLSFNRYEMLLDVISTVCHGGQTVHLFIY